MLPQAKPASIGSTSGWHVNRVTRVIHTTCASHAHVVWIRKKVSCCRRRQLLSSGQTASLNT